MWQDTESSKHLQQENLTNRKVRLHVTLTLINGLDWDNILKMPSSFISNSDKSINSLKSVDIFNQENCLCMDWLGWKYEQMQFDKCTFL